MSSFSPERELSRTLYRDVANTLTKLVPWEYQADCHVFMTGDVDVDRAVLEAIYKPADEGILEDTFEDLVEFFDESFDTAKPFLCEQWDIDDPEMLPWPEDETQIAAKYSATKGQNTYEITVAQWKQPTPYTDLPVEMISVKIEADSLIGPLMRITYYDGEPLLSCRYVETTMNDLPEVGWDNFGELSTDDLWLIHQLTKSIPLREFDTTP